MAHHGSNPFEGLSSEELRKMGMDEFVKSMPKEQATRINEMLVDDQAKFGATGNFPDGKISEADEGEIMVGIVGIEDRVVINFGKPIHWVGFTKEQAKQIAESLIKHSK